MARPAVPEDLIIDAAAALFAERGYLATSTSAIAQRAGINEVTLFRRFGSKQGLLAAFGRRLVERMAGKAVESVADPGDVRGTVAALTRLEFDSAERYGVAAMRLAMEARTVDEIREAMTSDPNDNLAGLAAYLGERQREGVVRGDISRWVMAESFFAMASTQRIARQMLGFEGPGDVSREELIEQIVELFCSAVLVERGTDAAHEGGPVQ